MEKTDKRYGLYQQILKEELVLAMGCTEPAAVAYCAAVARSVLQNPISLQECRLVISGNVIKNVKSVVVPNTGGLKGLETAAAAGIAVGNAAAGLQVLAEVQDSQKQDIEALLNRCRFTVQPEHEHGVFYVEVNLTTSGETSRAVLEAYHTNLTQVEHNGKPVEVMPLCCEETRNTQTYTDRSFMNLRDILDFVQSVELAEVEALLERQVDCNLAISQEGLENPWGAQVGRIMLSQENPDIYTRAAAAAAAGSDARMSGCEKPVAIISGSGNQGITASVPVAVYAKQIGASREQMLRAVLASDLVTIHQKTGIGRLSAFCGATSAGVGAACGIAYLDGAGYEEISHTIVNALAILSGMICDGAKPSCAAKIAVAVKNGIFGSQMYRQGMQFYGGDGIVTKGVDNTIANVGRLAKKGMEATDHEILDIMVGC